MRQAVLPGLQVALHISTACHIVAAVWRRWGETLRKILPVKAAEPCL